ncbi:MAG: phosphoribosylglycinamide formyltransferase [Alphaproteobacteria bacterium]|jgi:phosphoribosylglycinamide formyltransferase-1|nr:phosphoribosylglycinamide formyltransferase [Alphaproteobacteria bacterium]
MSVEKSRPIRIAILFSGRGSNMQTLANHIAQPEVNAEFTVAITNRPQAGGIDICKQLGVACHIIDHETFDARAAFDAALDDILRAAKVDLICCAGFMRLLTADFVNGWPDRLLNIHPSLLPKYKGLHTHKRALEAGDKEHGCTVHYMRPEMDDGPIIVQKKVPVRDDDTPDSLTQRVIEQEHIAYAEALDVVLKKMADT